MNYWGLSEKLFEALANYYKWWIERNPREKIYSIGFISEGLVSYSEAVIFSEQGLRKVAKEYKVLKNYQDESLVDLAKDLRWSAFDSPHQSHVENFFESVNAQLTEITNYTYSIEPDDPRLNKHINAMYGLFITALNRFRKNSLDNKQEIILSVWFGDQSEEEIEHFIRNCNGPKQIEKFNEEWNQTTP